VPFELGHEHIPRPCWNLEKITTAKKSTREPVVKKLGNERIYLGIGPTRLSSGIRATSILSSVIIPPKRGRPPVGAVVELQNELRRVQARMEAIEATQRREPDTRDVSEAENTSSSEEGEAPVGETTEEQLLRLVTKVGAIPKMEVPMYEGNLNVEELLD
jgi:hypothetical protein